MIAALDARKRTAAAALALALILTTDPAEAQSGWILMTAPFVAEPDYTRRLKAIEATPPGERKWASLQGLLNESAPLSEWNQFMAFDTAQACEVERSTFRVLRSDTFEKNQWSPDDAREVTGRNRIMSGRCVPASVIFGTTPRR